MLGRCCPRTAAGDPTTVLGDVSSQIPADNRMLKVFETYREDVRWEVYATCKVLPPVLPTCKVLPPVRLYRLSKSSKWVV